MGSRPAHPFPAWQERLTTGRSLLGISQNVRSAQLLSCDPTVQLLLSSVVSLDQASHVENRG